MASASARAEHIEQVFRDTFQPDHLEVLDESHRHRGHAGAASGGGHFRVTIVSSHFREQSRLARHRLLYGALGEAMGSDIHALALHAFTPEEWQARASS